MSAMLSAAEERVLDLMRQLPPTVVQEVEDFVTFLAARHSGWSYDDAASLEHAVQRMALDPFVQRESAAIQDEFACAESDGLKEWK